MIGETAHRALVHTREVAQSHHERWDGSGYPEKLKGMAIPLSARITSIAETYDALTNGRTSRSPLARTQKRLRSLRTAQAANSILRSRLSS
jgi:response regulator RpfG family c-di-GMP phosphodiesterase